VSESDNFPWLISHTHYTFLCTNQLMQSHHATWRRIGKEFLIKETDKTLPLCDKYFMCSFCFLFRYAELIPYWLANNRSSSENIPHFYEVEEVTYVVKKLFCFYGQRKCIIFIYNRPSLVPIIIKLNPVHHPPAPTSFLRPILILLTQYSCTIKALPPSFATDKRIEVNRYRPL